jgi:malate synthase
MVINALNSDLPKVFMADFEDSAAPTHLDETRGVEAKSQKLQKSMECSRVGNSNEPDSSTTVFRSAG